MLRLFMMTSIISLIFTSCSGELESHKQSEGVSVEGFQVQNNLRSVPSYNLTDIIKKSNNLTSILKNPCADDNGQKFCLGDRFYQKIFIHDENSGRSFNIDPEVNAEYANFNYSDHVSCVDPSQRDYQGQESEQNNTIIESCVSEEGQPKLDSLTKGEVNNREAFVSHQIHYTDSNNASRSMWVRYLSEAGHVYLVNPCQVINNKKGVQCAFGAEEAMHLGNLYSSYVFKSGSSWSGLTKREKRTELENAIISSEISIAILASAVVLFGIAGEAFVPALEALGFAAETASMISEGLEIGISAQMITSASINLSQSIENLENCKFRRCKRAARIAISADVLTILISSLPMIASVSSYFKSSTATQNLLSEKIYSSAFNLEDGMKVDVANLMTQERLAQLIATNDSIKSKITSISQLFSDQVITENSKNKLANMIFQGPKQEESMSEFLSRVDVELSKILEKKNPCGLNLTCTPNIVSSNEINSGSSEYKILFDKKVIRDSNFKSEENYSDSFGKIKGLDDYFLFRTYTSPDNKEASILKGLANLEPSTPGLIPELMAVSEDSNKAIIKYYNPFKPSHLENRRFDLASIEQQIVSMAKSLDHIHKEIIIDGKKSLISHNRISIPNIFSQSTEANNNGQLALGIKDFNDATIMSDFDLELKKYEASFGTIRLNFDPYLMKKKMRNKLVSFGELRAGDVWAMGMSMLSVLFGDQKILLDILAIDTRHLQYFYDTYKVDGNIRLLIESFFEKSAAEIKSLTKNKYSKSQIYGFKEFVENSEIFDHIMSMLSVNPADRPSASEVYDMMSSSLYSVSY